MIQFYADNSELSSIRENDIPDILVFGGVVVDKENKEGLCSVIRDIKSNYRSKADFPIKWCFKDLKNYYSSRGLGLLYDRLLQDSKNWRLEIFRQAASSNFKVVISIIRSYGYSRAALLRTKEGITRFAFSNALQRFGLLVKDRILDETYVILDWPADAQRSPFELEYKAAYQNGTTAVYKDPYKCGPLKNLGFSESVLFTSTNECTLLQFSDLIVGATRELVEDALEKKKGSFGISLLKQIRSNFHGAPDNVVGWGISVSPTKGDFYLKIKKKVLSLFI